MIAENTLHVSEEIGTISLIYNQAVESDTIIILAHGAGAGMHHPFLQKIAFTLQKAGINVLRFQFPYMEKGKKLPDKPLIALETIKAVYLFAKGNFKPNKIFLAGKSFGGRMSSLLLAQHPDLEVDGLIFYGFPLHPMGKPGIERADHLSQIQIPMLFLQGENDKLARLNLLEEVVENHPTATLKTLHFGDHSFYTPKKSGMSEEEVNDWLVTETTVWIKQNT